MSFIATGAGAGSLFALGSTGLAAGAGTAAAAGGAAAAGATAAGAAGAVGAAGAGTAAALPVAYQTAAASMTPATAAPFSAATKSVAPFALKPVAAPFSTPSLTPTLGGITKPPPNMISGPSQTGSAYQNWGGSPINSMSKMTKAPTPSMLSQAGGLLGSGLSNLNKVAEPAANISQAIEPYMGEDQGIQASPITPPTYSNNLADIVNTTETKNAGLRQQELQRRLAQREKIKELAMGGIA